MATVIVSPGGAGSLATSPPILTLTVAGNTGDLAMPGLQDVTINNANDVFTWTQLNANAKQQVATTSTNSISTNLVVDSDVFFGDGSSTAGSAALLGLLGLSDAKTRVGFTINIGAKTISGFGYVTGLAPSVSADSPVWVTPVTITVDGEFTAA
tara:strand:+ start:2420 stop:2881 length:462 start_codon:yes stop_codon:yes gene_type:complete